MIQKVKRSQNPMFKVGRADRTFRILAKQSDIHLMKKPIVHKFNLNDQFIDLKGMGTGDSTSI